MKEIFRELQSLNFFLPRTRNYDNEIFVATALKEFGILSPRTFNVNLNFNDYFEGNFIFQEKIVKELIEYNNLRESLILESDERDMFGKIQMIHILEIWMKPLRKICLFQQNT